MTQSAELKRRVGMLCAETQCRQAVAHGLNHIGPHLSCAICPGMIEAPSGCIVAENRQEGEALLHFSIPSLELHPSVESEKTEDVVKL